MAQKMEENFSTFEIEHTPRNENRFVDTLAPLGSEIIFERDSTRIEVNMTRLADPMERSTFTADFKR